MVDLRQHPVPLNLLEPRHYRDLGLGTLVLHGLNGGRSVAHCSEALGSRGGTDHLDYLQTAVRCLQQCRGRPDAGTLRGAAERVGGVSVTLQWKS